ncbi:hypothetical protein TNCV_1358231 [Trichonephila clavipes]|uniref:Uncharacterized protein n=1 Tax=Trichonephila clavipes TaxID=2585209 RepID=A0A8X6S6L8_TRICX|nr:hypothetical protein TNCV_1358231 [Trichonephila clavipes]
MQRVNSPEPPSEYCKQNHRKRRRCTSSLSRLVLQSTRPLFMLDCKGKLKQWLLCCCKCHRTIRADAGRAGKHTHFLINSP